VSSPWINSKGASLPIAYKSAAVVVRVVTIGTLPARCALDAFES
jgi:hypothetical protein